MRPDMSKVLVERPRLGARFRFGSRRCRCDAKTRCREGEEALPKSMPMRFAPSRALNENLEPLRRFLMKRRGRPWDDVYSEIRARLAPRSAVDMHVMQHLWAFVLFARRNAKGQDVLVDHYGRARATLTPDGRLAGRWGRGVFYVSCDARRLMLATSTREGSPDTDGELR